jgi:hypothetical protein
MNPHTNMGLGYFNQFEQYDFDPTLFTQLKNIAANRYFNAKECSDERFRPDCFNYFTPFRIKHCVLDWQKRGLKWA